MILSDLIQGSPEWLEKRKTCVTSSDASIINGSNTFRGNSPFKLWQRKLDLAKAEKVNEAMLEGTLLEVEARDYFNKKKSTNYKPQVGFHDEYEWMMVSLDGWDTSSDYILEIKCGEAAYNKAVNGDIPPYYIDQMQHQLYVSDQKACIYMAYRPRKEPVIMFVRRDDEHIEALIEKEKEFYDSLIKLEAPPFSEEEFIENVNELSNKKAFNWLELKKKLNQVTKDEKVAREELKGETDDGNMIFVHAGVKVQRINKIGVIDYVKLVRDYKIPDIELEKYRKPGVSWLQPTILKI